MFISKMKLSRRTLLRGMGAAISLPMLEAMVPALTAAQKPITRFGVVFTPLGQRPGYWEPKTVGKNFEFNAIMKPAEPMLRGIFRNAAPTHWVAGAGHFIQEDAGEEVAVRLREWIRAGAVTT